MKKSDLKHMAELALVRAIPDLIVGGLEKGPLKSQMRMLQKAVDLDLKKLRQPNKKNRDWVWEVVDGFRKVSGWDKKHHHPGTLVCFCLAIIDKSTRKFNRNTVNRLNQIIDHYVQEKDFHQPSSWAGDLACKRWLAIFGIYEEEGLDSQERLRLADEVVAKEARENDFEEYRRLFYPGTKEAA